MERAYALYQIDGRMLFTFFCLFLLVTTFLSREFLLTEEIYFSSLGEQMGADRIQAMLQLQKDWEWAGYLFVPIYHLFKFTIIALCLNTSTFIFNIQVHFKKLFQVAMLSELVFLLPLVIKMGWFLFVQTDFTLNDFQQFYPFSLLSLFETASVEQWLVYPLQLANVFEIAYWLILAYGLHQDHLVTFVLNLVFIVVRKSRQQIQNHLSFAIGRGVEGAAFNSILRFWRNAQHVIHRLMYLVNNHSFLGRGTGTLIGGFAVY